MPLVQVSIVEGRDPERKRRMMAGLTEVIVDALDVDQRQVRVLVYELPPAHWAVGGTTKEDAT